MAKKTTTGKNLALRGGLGQRGPPPSPNKQQQSDKLRNKIEEEKILLINFPFKWGISGDAYRNIVKISGPDKDSLLDCCRPSFRRSSVALPSIACCRRAILLLLRHSRLLLLLVNRQKTMNERKFCNYDSIWTNLKGKCRYL